MASAFDELCTFVRQTAMLESVESVLQWDERTYMPPEAGSFRAEQMAYLAGQVHLRRTDSRIGPWLEAAAGEASDGPHGDRSSTIRLIRRDYQRNTRLPQALVEELTRTTSLAQQAWVEARKNNDFKGFAPWLEKVFHLKRQQAQCLGYTDSPYDALLDDYEHGAKTREVAAVLARLREKLLPLLEEIRASSNRPPVEILHRQYPAAAQQQFGEQAARAIGFSFARGRLDVTAHPFCSSLGPHDCRITTRYDEQFFPGAFFGILHEAGHGIYDQGVRCEFFGLPPGSYISLGIHESQSRMWENQVGRSQAFWKHFFPRAQTAFPQALAGVSLSDFYFAINDVRPSLIRVEADEATYNLHIIVRFELEQALLAGDLPVADLPGVWREKYRQYLGVAPQTDADGALQDIHWSAGLVGYFPTYSLGNLYAAQFFRRADRDLGGLAAQLARGEFAPLKQWLNQNIHSVGQNYTAAELVQKVTGEPLNPDYLLDHLRQKLSPLYGK